MTTVRDVEGMEKAMLADLIDALIVAARKQCCDVVDGVTEYWPDERAVKKARRDLVAHIVQLRVR